jgi:hypothetical protein
MVQNILVLSSWLSGSSSVVDFLERCGASICRPLTESDGNSSFNPYESEDFRAMMAATIIFEHFDVDLFSQKNQTTPEIQHDYMSWSVLSLIYWYQLCFQHNPEIIYRVEEPASDLLLSEYLGLPISRDEKSLRVKKAFFNW